MLDNKTIALILMALIVGGLLGYLFGAQQTPIGVSDKQLAFKQDMRKLWTDHAVWTRLYIISFAAGSPDADAAATRLLKNQEDIGSAVGQIYGKEAGDKLTVLLKEHIMIAVDLLNAAKEGDSQKVADADQRWRANADDIAKFLSSANPNLPEPVLRDLLNEHLDTTLAEATARLQGDWGEDVKTWDAVYNHILVMSDALAAGIIKQFPEKFK